jgi:trehalose 6-phosphate synthase/phosphatase
LLVSFCCCSGFCNNLLWPLFHYIPLPVEAITTADEQFEAYKTANEAFADAVLACYEEGDIVWVHDYHLLLLPHMLRAKHPNIKIGFFFHTPFPSVRRRETAACDRSDRARHSH